MPAKRAVATAFLATALLASGVLVSGCSCGASPLAELASMRAEPIGPALCAPALVCGCDRGCVRFEPVPPVGGSERFREVGGEPATLHFRTRAGWMAIAASETCDESCPEPQSAPPYACVVEGEGCAQASGEAVR